MPEHGPTPDGDRLLARFLELVRIDSPSGEEADVAAYCAEELVALGFEVRFDDSPPRTGSNSGNLVAERAGSAPDAPVLVLSAHMDCVEPCRGVSPVIEGGIVSSAGDTVLGADDKAGIAAILEAARRIGEADGPRPAVKVVLTVCEEVGLSGAKALEPADARGDACLVLDADGVPGGIVIAAPTHYTFTATFQGVASHAGVAPEAGRSALVMASRFIAAVPIGRLDARTTANIGTVNGGTATNVIAAEAVVTGECRSLDAARVEEVRASMAAAMEAAAEEGGGSVEVSWTREYSGFSFAEDAPLVRLAVQACCDAGLDPVLKSTGGGSDGNIFAGHGVPTLVLSCGMSGVHGTGESVAVADLHALAALVEAFAHRLAGE